MDILNKIKDQIKNPEQVTNVTEKTISNKPLNFFNKDRLYGVLKAELVNNIKNSKPRDYFRASELGDCAVRLYYRLKGTQPDLQRATRNHMLPLRAHVGNAVHDFIQKKYNFSHVEYSLNSDNFHIHARVDGIIDNEILIEIKTVENASLVREKDLFQLAANYLLLKEASFNIKLGQLIYVPITLRSIETYDFSQEQLENLSKEVRAKTQYVMKCINDNTPPQNFISKKDCGWCEYHHLCPFKNSK